MRPNYPGTARTLYSTLRAKLSGGIRCRSDITFALGVSLAWLLLYNFRFWEQAAATMWHPDLGAALFMASLFLLVLSVQAILVLLAPSGLLMRAAASGSFIIAALGSYFCSTYGAVMDKDMMRNVLQTDPAEIGGLLTPGLVTHVLVLGVLPALLIWRISLPATSWKRRLRQRAVFIPAALLLSLAGLFACSADYAVFFREHKPVRFMLSPSAEITSMAGLLAESRSDTGGALRDPAGIVQRTASPHAKPLVLFLVVGETARAANFQLAGYARPTNPHLSALDGLIHFNDVSSCGTATAISVPCMFSPLGRARFDVAEAGRSTNLLDSLTKAGLDVEWRDNDAGCKGVCARVRTIDYQKAADSQLCQGSHCYDEIMLTDLPDKLRTLKRDTAIVFHMIGSHGPAYYERYPPQFERFKPACRSNQLQRCTPEELRNAYDNTIAYTDNVLSRQIELLRAAADQVDGLLIYVSDHGESLGENGIYLHGMPYTFAPAVQKKIPMLMWVSPEYAQRAELQPGCLQARATLPASHDNLYHTVLAAAEVRNQAYDQRLDLLSGCRRDAAGRGFE